MIERGSYVEAREPHQRITEPTVDVAQRKAELRRLRKPGLNVTYGKQRERVAFAMRRQWLQPAPGRAAHKEPIARA